MIYNMKIGRIYFHFEGRVNGSYFYTVNADLGELSKPTGATEGVAEYYCYEDGKEEIIFYPILWNFRDINIEFIKAIKILRDNIQ